MKVYLLRAPDIDDHDIIGGIFSSIEESDKASYTEEYGPMYYIEEYELDKYEMQK